MISPKRLGVSSSELAADRVGLRPIWIRAPKQGHEPHCGLTRAHLYSLAQRGLIRTSCLRDPGALKGVRLFHLPSILAYIESHEVLSPEPSGAN